MGPSADNREQHTFESRGDMLKTHEALFAKHPGSASAPWRGVLPAALVPLRGSAPSLNWRRRKAWRCAREGRKATRHDAAAVIAIERLVKSRLAFTPFVKTRRIHQLTETHVIGAHARVQSARRALPAAGDAPHRARRHSGRSGALRNGAHGPERHLPALVLGGRGAILLDGRGSSAGRLGLPRAAARAALPARAGARWSSRVRYQQPADQNRSCHRPRRRWPGSIRCRCARPCRACITRCRARPHRRPSRIGSSSSTYVRASPARGDGDRSGTSGSGGAPRRTVVARSPRGVLPPRAEHLAASLPPRTGPQPNAPRHLFAHATRREAARAIERQGGNDRARRGLRKPVRLFDDVQEVGRLAPERLPRAAALTPEGGATSRSRGAVAGSVGRRA